MGLENTYKFKNAEITSTIAYARITDPPISFAVYIYKDKITRDTVSSGADISLEEVEYTDQEIADIKAIQYGALKRTREDQKIDFSNWTDVLE